MASSMASSVSAWACAGVGTGVGVGAGPDMIGIVVIVYLWYQKEDCNVVMRFSQFSQVEQHIFLFMSNLAHSCSVHTRSPPLIKGVFLSFVSLTWPSSVGMNWEFECLCLVCILNFNVKFVQFLCERNNVSVIAR